MNADRGSHLPSREHNLYVAISKFVYNHPEHGVVFVRDPITISAAAEYGLTPLILYGLSPAQTAIHCIRFSAATSPVSLLEILQEAWRTAPGLRGCPDTLKVSRHVAKSSPRLVQELERLGVQLVVADGKDKRFSASLRNGQSVALGLGWRFQEGKPALDSIDALNRTAVTHHQQQIERRSWELRPNRDIAERTRQWMELPEETIGLNVPTSLDWEPGPWLSAWQVSLPPATPRVFTESYGVKWLVTPQSFSATGVHDVWEEEAPGDDSYDLAAEKVKLMVDCWPNEPLAIAKAVGITAKELNWYLTGQTSLAGTVRFRLLSILGITYVPNHGDYSAVGPCALVATSIRAVTAAYDELTGGGDLQCSFEAVPDKGIADPSWRYVVFKAYSNAPCVIMIPRGGAVAKQLNDRTFINFDGPLTIKSSIYHDIVASCGRASISPEANISEMLAFANRHERYFLQLCDTRY